MEHKQQKLNIWLTYSFIASMQSTKEVVPKSQSMARMEKKKENYALFYQAKCIVLINLL